MRRWEQAARLSVLDTIARYAHAVDTGRFDDLADCFTVDGILEVVGSDRIAGREAIRGYLGRVGVDLAAATTVPVIRHHVASVTIDVGSRRSATARSYFFVVTERGPDHWGRYRDELRPDGPDRRWRLVHRVARTDGTAPGGWARSR